MVEWAELSATLPDLTSMRGVKIFYKVASPTTTASPSDANNDNASNSMSGSNINRDTSPMSQLSSLNRAIPIPRCLYQWWSVVGCARMMKPLGVLAWKCKKLRIGSKVMARCSCSFVTMNMDMLEKSEMAKKDWLLLPSLKCDGKFDGWKLHAGCVYLLLSLVSRVRSPMQCVQDIYIEEIDYLWAFQYPSP